MHTPELAKFLDEKAYPSSDVIIYHNHKEIFRYFRGSKDAAGTMPIDGSEIYFLYSATKPITCTAAMQLIERGIIGIDDPVSKYIPEYAHLTYKDGDEVKECKEVMTVRHLFAMRAGFNYGNPVAWQLKNTMPEADTIEAVKALITHPLDFEPGTDFRYSFCHDVLAAIVEIASGMKFSECLKMNVFEPLGMNNTGFHVTEDMLPRFAEQYNFVDGEIKPISKSCRFKLTDNYESGGAGLYSCIDDYIKFADALANHGTAFNGYQLLKPETVELMRANQNFHPDLPVRAGYGYAFGVRTMLDPIAAGSDAPTAFEFGWDGAAGAYVAIDPYHKLTCVYLHHVMNHGKVYEETHPVIRDTMYYIAGICNEK